VKLGNHYGGYLRSPPHARGTRALHEMLPLVGDEQLPPSADFSSLLPVVLDQGQQGSCTGHGVGEAIWGAQNRLRVTAGQSPVERPSPAWLYYVARVLDGDAAEDVGSSPSSVLHGAEALGFVSNAQLSYSDSVLEPPHDRIPELERLAYDQKLLTGTARITSTGTQRVRDIQTALAAGYLVTFGTDVDDAFEALGPTDVWPGVTGTVLGGHCMCLTGYRTVSGRVQFRVRNSWGSGWCDGGSCWFDQGAIAGCDDIWIVSAAPDWSGTADS